MLIYAIGLFFLHTTLFAQQEWEKHVKIVDSRTGESAGIEDVVAAMEHVDVLFFGEEHNDSIAHLVQAALYQSLLRTYSDVTLSMEMFERDAQLVVDEYLGGHITEAKLEAEGKAWKNYADYAPLVHMAQTANQPVIAANVPTRYANLVSRKGLNALHALPKVARKYLTAQPVNTDQPLYEQKFNQAMGGHGHGMGPTIFHAQLLRDATMAESISKAWRQNKRAKILHLNGRFHSDESLGTVAALQSLRKKIAVLTVSCFSPDDFEDPDWEKHAPMGDFIILTDPNVPKSF